MTSRPVARSVRSSAPAPSRSATSAVPSGEGQVDRLGEGGAGRERSDGAGRRIDAKQAAAAGVHVGDRIRPPASTAIPHGSTSGGPDASGGSAPGRGVEAVDDAVSARRARSDR